MHNPYSTPGLSDAAGDNPYATASGISEVDPDAPCQPEIFALEGRIGRLRLIAYSLPAALLWAGVYILVKNSPTVTHGFEPSWSQVSLILLSMLPFMIVSRRRLHDLNHPGTWLLLYATPLSPVLLFFLLFGDGQRGRNNYGAPPAENSPGVYAVALLVILGLFAVLVVYPYLSYQVHHQQTGFNQ